MEEAARAAPEAAGGLGLSNLFRAASKFSLANMLGALVGIPLWLVVARLLGPDALGKAQYVLLAYAYAGFVRLGTFEGGQRRLIDEIAKGNTGHGRRAQNIGLTIDLFVSCLAGLALVVMAVQFHDPVRRLGFALAPVAVVAASLASYLGSLHLAHQRFALVAKMSLLRQVGGPIAVAAGVWVLGAPGLFVVPLIADCAVVGVYLFRGPSLGLSFAFERREARQLLREGFPLGAMALVYWSYRLAGNTAAALWIGVEGLAFYAFAAMPISLAIRAMSGVSTVLAPRLWSELSHAPTPALRRQARTIIILLTFGGAVIVNAGQATFGPVVASIIPEFLPSLPAFAWLSFGIVLYAVPIVPSLLLDSLAVNKQWRHLWIWVGALAANLAIDYLVVENGFGIVGLAITDSMIQLAVAVALLATAGRHLVEHGGGPRLLLRVGVILLWSGVVATLLAWLPSGAVSDGGWNLMLLAALRFLGVCAAWAVPSAVLARRVRSRSI